MMTGFGAQGGILTLELRDEPSLYEAYMPFVKGGGLFIKTTRVHKMGDDIFVLLSLLEQDEPTPLTAKVVWISPAGSNTYPQGIGVQFGSENIELMNRIETQLTDRLGSSESTSTM